MNSNVRKMLGGAVAAGVLVAAAFGFTQDPDVVEDEVQVLAAADTDFEPTTASISAPDVAATMSRELEGTDLFV